MLTLANDKASVARSRLELNATIQLAGLDEEMLSRSAIADKAVGSHDEKEINERSVKFDDLSPFVKSYL